MKAKEMKYNEKIIELLDGKHKIGIDFNAFEALEEIYGDMQTAFVRFTDGNVKFADIKNFICAGVNACIEDIGEHYTPFQIGKLIDINNLGDYMDTIMQLLNNAMPVNKNDDEDIEEKN